MFPALLSQDPFPQPRRHRLRPQRNKESQPRLRKPLAHRFAQVRRALSLASRARHRFIAPPLLRLVARDLRVRHHPQAKDFHRDQASPHRIKDVRARLRARGLALRRDKVGQEAEARLVRVDPLRASRNAQAQAALIKHPSANKDREPREFPRQSRESRCTRANLPHLAGGRSSRRDTPRVSASSIPFALARELGQAVRWLSLSLKLSASRVQLRSPKGSQCAS
jgi:hypothetical protein